jgi:hypothetical protein
MADRQPSDRRTFPPGALAAALLLAVLAALAIVGATAYAIFTDVSNVTNNTFSTDTLDPPTGLTASVVGSDIQLDWTPTADTYATGYEVQRGTESGGPYGTIDTVTPYSATTYTDDTVVLGTRYYYVLQTYFQNWLSVYSNEVSASVITFRGGASAGAASGTLSLTISKPSGTVEGDVMIASIAVRPDTAVITAPANWTLVRRVDNANPNANSLAVYYKVAGASEPADYTWTFSTSTGSAGGIQSFLGADQGNPINVENGQNTASGLTHATPSVITTVNNTMLVTSHAFTSSATWTPPGGMTEVFDVASETVPAASGISIEGNCVIQAAAGATGAKTATASNDADVGNTHILALKPAP